MKKVKSFDNMYYIYDPFLITYLTGKQITDFLYVDTRTSYDTFLSEREEADAPRTLVASSRIFNRAIRDRFPTLDRKHVSKDGRNFYIWVLRD